ncbi:MAG: DUF4268 domain-containing protein [Bacteroidota bacterium]|nr:DUF4268 domain-containing protein [Bacteroidota bacterium]
MYTRQETSLIRQKFWTSFGQYMRPVKGAGGEPTNWINYKTGIRHLYFRMDAGSNLATVAIELRQKDVLLQQQYMEQFQQMKAVLEELTGEAWDWEWLVENNDGSRTSRISKTITGVNIFNEDEWPAIISFLKPRIMALDHFWILVKDGFE